MRALPTRIRLPEAVALLAAGETPVAVAARLGVRASTVSRVAYGQGNRELGRLFAATARAAAKNANESELDLMGGGH